MESKLTLFKKWKILFIACCVFLIPNLSFTQCPSGIISFNTIQEKDDFLIENPGCEVYIIVGTLIYEYDNSQNKISDFDFENDFLSTTMLKKKKSNSLRMVPNILLHNQSAYGSGPLNNFANSLNSATGATTVIAEANAVNVPLYDVVVYMHPSVVPNIAAANSHLSSGRTIIYIDEYQNYSAIENAFFGGIGATTTTATGYNNFPSCPYPLSGTHPLLAGVTSVAQAAMGQIIAGVNATSVMDAAGYSRLLVEPVGGGTLIVGSDYNMFVEYCSGSDSQVLLANMVNYSGDPCSSDLDAPTAICQDVTIFLDENGEASIVPSDIDNGSNDACDMDLDLSLDIDEFLCADTVGVTVTLTVTDDAGNFAECTALVTVLDMIPPDPVCDQNSATTLDVFGFRTITASQLDSDSDDNCTLPENLSFSYSPTDINLTDSLFTCDDVGLNMVSIWVWDESGNVSEECFAQLNVYDNTAPFCQTQDVTINLDAAGSASIVPGDVDNGSSDACGIASMAVSPNTFDCSNLGDNTVTLTLTDVNGNVSTCDATVHIDDVTPPTAVCQDITVQLDAAGAVTIAATDVDNGSSDICGIATLEINNDSFGCGDVGANTVILTVTDVADPANQSTCTSTVTVEDNVPPVVVCEDITVQLDASGNGNIVASMLDGGSTDACGIDATAYIATQTSFTCNDIGDVTVTLTVVDNNGNEATCDATVTVEDNIAPIMNCQDFDVYLDANGSAILTSAMADGGSSDNCGITSLTVGPEEVGCDATDFSEFSLIGDYNGRRYYISSNPFTWVDAKADAMEHGGELSSFADAAEEAHVLSGASGAQAWIGYNDMNVEGDFVWSNGDADAYSNWAPSEPNNSGNEDGTVINWTGVQWNDLPANSGSWLRPYILEVAIAAAGEVSVVLVAEDGSGNTASCLSLATVIDTIKPEALCQNITVQLDDNGEYSIVVDDVDNGSNDACGIESLSIDVTDFTCADVDNPVTVTLTVLDVNGNESTCTSTVTVEDNVAPEALCKNITVQLDDDGEVSISGMDVDNGSDDACGIDTMYVDIPDFTCADVGDNTVTLTVVDNNGNEATCTSTVTVEDNVAPECITKDITVSLDNFGNYTVDAEDIDDGSNDACGIASYQIRRTDCFEFVFPFGFVSVPCDWEDSIDFEDCDDLGDNLVELLVTDVNDNTSVCDATVTIEDNTSPFMNCQDNIIVSLNNNGEGLLIGANLLAWFGVYDACGPPVLLVDGEASQMYTCDDLGSQMVVVTAIDNNGNQTQCMVEINVQDKENPDCIAMDINVYLDENGVASIDSNAVDNGSSDNCTIVSITLDNQDFTCAMVGENTVTMTVEDQSGNTSECDAIVTVIDTIKPICITKDIDVYLDDAGEASIDGNAVDDGSNDACGVASINLDIQDFTCADVDNPVTVTQTVIDVNGNISTCTAVVTVLDTVPPMVMCNDITVQLDASGEVAVTGEMVAGTVTISTADLNGSNNGSGSLGQTYLTAPVTSSITLDIDWIYNTTDVDGPSFDKFGYHLNGAFIQISDDSGANSQSGTFSITLNPGDVFGPQMNATDNIFGSASGTFFGIDFSGDLDQANWTLTNINANGSGSINPGVPSSTDACGIASYEIDMASFDCSNVGPNDVTVTVTDVNGNQSMCMSTVTVEDNVAPVAVCQDITVELDDNGQITITGAMIDGGSEDACGIASLTASPSVLTCDDLGDATVTLTVEDVNGNISTCDATVTVEDNIAPTMVCQDITVVLDSDGNGIILPSDVDNGSSDNCSIVEWAVGPEEVGCEVTDFSEFTYLGEYGGHTYYKSTNQYNFYDALADATEHGGILASISDASENGIAATLGGSSWIGFNDIRVEGDFVWYSGEAISYTNWLGGEPNNLGNEDGTIINFGGAGLWNDVPINLTYTYILEVATTGANEVSVVLHAEDQSGNTASCLSVATLSDITPPDAICQNITVQLDAAGIASIDNNAVDNGSTDACGIASFSTDITDFTCDDVGDVAVVLTVTDNYGNVSTCDATVTVEDNVPPVAVCQDITVQLDFNGNVTITGTMIDGGSTDACGIESLDAGEGVENLDCSNVGDNIITLTVTDVNGNESQCDATVTVEDNIAPLVNCVNNVEVPLNTNGIGFATKEEVTGATFDACGIVDTFIIRNDDPSHIDYGIENEVLFFDCEDIGLVDVIIRVYDTNGNVEECNTAVNVKDEILPTMECTSATIYLDVNGVAALDSNALDNGSYDNCAIVEFSVSQTDFDCSHLGMNLITMTAEDQSGNSSTCANGVMVIDTFAPVALCKDITVQLDALGTATITGAMLDNGSTDACGPLTFSADITSFGCNDVGANIVVMTVMDGSGNASTCTSTVTVEDNIAPDAQCTDIVVQLDSDGLASIASNAVDNGSSDACGIASINLDIQDFTCADVDNPVTVTQTVIDVNGNISTCTAVVTVEDNVAPMVTCNDITVQLDGSGEVAVTGEMVAGTVTVSTADLNGSNTGTGGLGQTYLTVPLTSSVTIDIDWIYNTTDVDGPSYDLFGYYLNGSFIQLSDDLGPNSQSGSFTITLNPGDVFGPQINATDNALGAASGTFFGIDFSGDLDQANWTLTNINANGSGSINPGVPSSTDACGIASYDIDMANFDCSNVGPNDVTVTVTDVNGNQSMCMSTVTVEDNVAPIAVCQDITVQLDDTGNASVTGADIDGGSTDACGIALLTASPNAFTCANVGTNTVTLTVIDNNGNESTCDATVTVEDNVDPTALCAAYTVQLDDAGNATISATDVDGGSSDACGIASMTVSPSAFTCANVGDNTVTLTITDNNGNVGTCDATVTVEDNVAPEAICQNIIVELDANGEASIDSNAVDNLSTDACGIASFSTDVTSFDCSNLGDNTVVMTVTDVNGNASNCTATVTVVDVTGPVLTCPADIIVNTLPSDCNQNVIMPALSPMDVCSGLATYEYVSVDITFIDTGVDTFALFPVGDTEVKVIATDGFGNTSECTFNVTVIDNIDPIITGCDVIGDITVDGDVAQCGANVTWDEDEISANDNCSGQGSGVSISSNYEPGDLFPVGTTTVTYTATDDSGNMATCSFDVTVNSSLPVADFTTLPTSLSVIFTNASANANTYSWDFGDANTSTDENPTHVYAAAGTYNVCLTAENACGDMDTYCEDVIVNDTGECLDVVALNAGWNLISFDVAPTDNQITTMFANEINSGNLIMITAFNSTGALLFDPVLPPFLNSLQTIEPGYGYWVQVTSASSISAVGACLDPAFKVDLTTGWNLVSFIPQAPTPPQVHFSSLITDGVLDLVTGYDGGSKIYDPSFPIPALNTLTDLENGLGYWVKVTTDVSATDWLKGSPSSSGSRSDENLDEWGNLRTSSYDFLSGTVEGIADGEIINVVNDFGDIIVELEVIQNGYLSMTPIYGDDSNTPDEIDGLIFDEELFFEYKGIRSEISIDFKGTSTIHFVDLEFENTTTGVSIVANELSASVAPNPMVNSTTLSLDVPSTGDYTIQLMDMTGKKVRSVHTGLINAGLYETSIDRNGLVGGQYIIAIIDDSGSYTRIPLLVIN